METYFLGTQAIIYVIDSADYMRIQEAKEELFKVLNSPDLKKPVLLVLANKQDLSNVLGTEDITKELELEKLEGYQWYVQRTCAVSGDGLIEGLAWLNSFFE